MRRTIVKLFKGSTLDELETVMQTWIDAKERRDPDITDTDPLPKDYKLIAETATPFTVGEVPGSQLTLPQNQQQMKISFCLLVCFSAMKG
jgi:hypothetical protein